MKPLRGGDRAAKEAKRTGEGAHGAVGGEDRRARRRQTGGNHEERILGGNHGERILGGSHGERTLGRDRGKHRRGTNWGDEDNSATPKKLRVAGSWGQWREENVYRGDRPQGRKKKRGQRTKKKSMN
jgi:hypothetical protein